MYVPPPINAMSRSNLTEDECAICHEPLYVKNNLPLIYVEVPQQNNGYDCGMFLLHYAILFMMCDSKHALASELKEGNKKDWFDCEVPSNLRQSLKMAVVKELEALQKWRGVAETDDGVAT